jgi:hypothetical protein
VSNKLSRKVVQHLQNAKALIATKIESWRGREPFPGEPEKLYRQMLSDVSYELHEYETVEGQQPEMSPHLSAVLREYKSILEDTILFWTSLDSATASTYESILKDLESILTSTAVQPGTPVPIVARRPNVRCIEMGRCKIKVTMDETRADSPTQNAQGMWVFGDPDVYRQNRECLTCSRKWVTSVNHNQQGTYEIQAPVRIQL